MSGTLYLVATPIGNLGDFSPRAAETLGAVDFIAAEDTRVSVKLLNHFQRIWCGYVPKMGWRCSPSPAAARQ